MNSPTNYILHYIWEIKQKYRTSMELSGKLSCANMCVLECMSKGKGMIHQLRILLTYYYYEDLEFYEKISGMKDI